MFAKSSNLNHASTIVLVGAYMPAVLVELGFLSHPAEERRLGNQSDQRRIASALGDAILAYREKLGRQELEAAATGEGGDDD